jgi:hypothetical protein
MKRIGAVLVVLGLVMVVIAVKPELALESPSEGFGPMQTNVSIAGMVAIALGLIVHAIGQKMAKAAPAEAAPAEPAAEEPAPEPAAEEPAEAKDE